jgi:hypothetical protein
MKVETEFSIGDCIYLKTDIDQYKRIITEITILPNNLFVYEVSLGSETCKVYEFEISVEKDLLLHYGG